MIFLETQSFVFEHVMNLIHTPIARTPMISWVVSGSCQVIMIHPASRIVKAISIYPSERIRSQVGRVRLFKVQPPPHLQSPHLLRLSVSPPSHPPLQVWLTIGMDRLLPNRRVQAPRHPLLRIMETVALLILVGALLLRTPTLARPLDWSWHPFIIFRWHGGWSVDGVSHTLHNPLFCHDFFFPFHSSLIIGSEFSLYSSSSCFLSFFMNSLLQFFFFKSLLTPIHQFFFFSLFFFAFLQVKRSLYSVMFFFVLFFL